MKKYFKCIICKSFHSKLHKIKLSIFLNLSLLHSSLVQTSITRPAQSSWSAGHLTTVLPWLRGSVAAYRCGVCLELTSSALWERILRRWTHTHTHACTHTPMQSYTLHTSLTVNSYPALFFCFYVSLYFCVLTSGIVLMVPRRTPLKSALWYVSLFNTVPLFIFQQKKRNIKIKLLIYKAHVRDLRLQRSIN